MNKYELAKKINELEGLTNDEKSELIKLLRSQKKYGLVWEDKPEDAEQRMVSEQPVLVEVPERAILSDDAEAPNHILIEGDNLEALTALSYTHAGKIDVIYIDPPYNRGDNDFMYNDKFIDNENPFKHSLWLSFMNKRLKLAKRLLKSDGVLIAHIDEHEFDSLSMLLRNDIFGEECNLGLIVWNKMNPKGDAHAVANMHEYILLFCKNKEAFGTRKATLLRKKNNAEKIIAKAKSLYGKIGKSVVPDDVKKIMKLYGYPAHLIKDLEIDYDYARIATEYKAWLNSNDFSKGEKAYKYIDSNGEVFRTVSMAWPNKEEAPSDYWKPLYHPVTGEECPLPSRGWRNPSKTMEKLLGTMSPIDYGDIVVKGEIAFSINKKGECNIPERIYYLKDNMMENVPSIYNDGSSSDKLLSELQVSFPYPKCMNVATYLIKNVIGEVDLTILDFFAGSGTTLHATMQLNAEDGGHRQCILVTNNENGICEKVTYERNRKVIQGYTTPKGEEIPGLKANNLRYYKTHLLPREQTIRNKRALVAASTDLLCIKNDVYAEQERFAGKKLKPSCARYFDNGKTKMLVIYNELTVNAFAETIYHMEVDGKILIYVFSNTRYAYDDNFEDVLDKVELCALPAAIYDAYRNILPEQEMKFENPMTESENDTDNEVTSDDSSEQMASSEHDTQLSFDFK